jgi:hypothetical protein
MVPVAKPKRPFQSVTEPSIGSEPSEQREPLVYPDPLFSPSLVDGAAFLYFQDRIILTLAPTPALAGGGFEMVDWVHDRRPAWGPRFLALNELWGLESDGCVAVMELLAPLRDHFTSALIAVPGDTEALDRAGELLSAASFDRNQMRTVADPVVAAGELMNHLYLEMWLTFEEDVEALYAYTAELLADEGQLEETLHRAYLLRLAHLPSAAPSLNAEWLAEMAASSPEPP